MDTNNQIEPTLIHSLLTVGETAEAKPTKRRRKFSIEQKRKIVEEALSSDDSFSVVARRHNVNTNLLFKWRQLYRQGGLYPKDTLPGRHDTSGI